MLSLTDNACNQAGSGLAKQVIKRVPACRCTAGYTLHGKFFLDNIAIKTPGCGRAAQPLPQVTANATVLECAAIIEPHLQQPVACIIANGAQSARMYYFHFHGIAGYQSKHKQTIQKCNLSVNSLQPGKPIFCRCFILFCT